MSTVDGVCNIVYGIADLQKLCVGWYQPLSSGAYLIWGVSLSDGEVRMAGTRCGWRKCLATECHRLAVGVCFPVSSPFLRILPCICVWCFLLMEVVPLNPCLWSTSQSSMSLRRRGLLRCRLVEQFSPLSLLCVVHGYVVSNVLLLFLENSYMLRLFVTSSLFCLVCQEMPDV